MKFEIFTEIESIRSKCHCFIDVYLLQFPKRKIEEYNL